MPTYHPTTGFERVKTEQGVIENDEIGLTDYYALVGICRARLVLNHVPCTLDVSQAILNLESKLPPSGTPLSRQVYAAAHANYNTPNEAMNSYFAGRDFTDPLEREGRALEGSWPA